MLDWTFGFAPGSRPSQSDYTEQAQRAAEQGDYALALQQLAGAFSFDPSAMHPRTVFSLVLAKVSHPARLLPLKGSVFFGVVALHAAVLAHESQLSKALTLLMRVVEFRPEIGYLAWAVEWCQEKSIRGVSVAELLGLFASALQQAEYSPDTRGLVVNLESLVALASAFAQARPALERQLTVIAVRAQELMDRRMDPVAEAIRHCLRRYDETEMSSRTAVVRLRLRGSLVTPSARTLFRAALHARGRTGALLVDDDVVSEVARPEDHAALAAQVGETMAMLSDGRQPSLEQLRVAYEWPVLSADEDPVAAFELQRRDLLHCAQRQFPVLTQEWCEQLARSSDHWAARPALALRRTLDR